MRIIDWSSDVGPSDLVAFNLERHDFFADLRRKACGSPLNQTEAWAIFNQFFTDEMHRQPMTPGASRALSIISEQADVVVLTNPPHSYAQARTSQLLGHGIPFRVACNQGQPGPELRRLLEEF